MKNTDTFGVHFTIRQSKIKNGKVPIYARITVNKSRVDLSIKREVVPEEWNNFRGFAKPKTETQKLLNNYLEEVRSKIVNHYQQIKLKNGMITAANLKNEYLGLNEKVKDRTLLWLATEHNVIMEKKLAWGSLKNYYTTKKYLENFLKKHYGGDILLSKLNCGFLTSFEYYLRNNPLKSNDPCTNNGTMKHLERVKKMANWAKLNDWVEKNPFDNFKLKYKYLQRESLTVVELSKIENHSFENLTLEKVKDFFIFCCYTGLSYADVMELKTTNVLEAEDGFTWLKKLRTKTNVPIDVPLLKKATTYFEKLSTKEKAPNRDAIFHYISNQEVNRSLKLIAEICGISKNLSFHLASHTFATTVCLSNGVSIDL